MTVRRWPARDRRQGPFLITEAQPPPSELHARRKRRYAITMGVRALSVVAAAISYQILWLMPLFAVVGTVLPLIAVIMANDRPPRKRLARYGGARRPQRPMLPLSAIDPGHAGHDDARPVPRRPRRR